MAKKSQYLPLLGQLLNGSLKILEIHLKLEMVHLGLHMEMTDREMLHREILHLHMETLHLETPLEMRK